MPRKKKKPAPKHRRPNSKNGGHVQTRRPKRWPNNVHMEGMLREWGTLRHLGRMEFGKEDYRGREIPDGLRRTFDHGELVREWLVNWMANVCEFVTFYSQDIVDDSPLARIDLDFIKQTSSTLVSYISDNLPGVICPYCVETPPGETCVCHDLGWLPWREVMNDGQENPGTPLAAATELEQPADARDAEDAIAQDAGDSLGS